MPVSRNTMCSASVYFTQSISGPARPLRGSTMFLGCVLSVLGCHRAARPVEPMHELRPDQSIKLAGASAGYVKVEPVTETTQSPARALFGQVAFDERHLAMIGPPVQGRVSRVTVVVGDRVVKDQVLLTIHAPDIAAARAQVAQARTARALAERNVERAALLEEKGAGSDTERLQAAAAAAQARTEEERALGAVNALGTGVAGSSEYQLRSPIAGVVVERNVSVGTEVHTDQDKPVVKVADLSTVWVLADVYEQDLARVKVGDEATVEVLSFGGHPIPGRITSIGNTADPQTRVVRARIELANPDQALRPGMFARIEVRASGGGGIQVPVGAVLARRDQFFVFVRNPDGGFHQREVRLGEQHGEHVSILSGLKPGESIVSEGAILLDAEANEAL